MVAALRWTFWGWLPRCWRAERCNHVRARVSSDPQSQLSHSDARAAGAMPRVLEALDWMGPATSDH